MQANRQKANLNKWGYSQSYMLDEKNKNVKKINLPQNPVKNSNKIFKQCEKACSDNKEGCNTVTFQQTIKYEGKKPVYSNFKCLITPMKFDIPRPISKDTLPEGLIYHPYNSEEDFIVSTYTRED